jgi:hypothetical protein
LRFAPGHERVLREISTAARRAKMVTLDTQPPIRTLVGA